MLARGSATDLACRLSECSWAGVIEQGCPDQQDSNDNERKPHAPCLGRQVIAACVVQAPAERACAKFAAGASVAAIQAVNPRPIKRSTIVSYIAAAAGNNPEGVDFGRLAEEARLTHSTAAAIASGTVLLQHMHVSF